MKDEAARKFLDDKAIQKIMSFVGADNSDFAEKLLKGATAEEREAFFLEFPEYRELK